tara:strand:- start:68 stop:691 length:624 start_codon:yes stop_codon:yes gene_type:complete
MLASASSARHRLLEQAGISHRSMVSGVDEDGLEYSSASNLVHALALTKAKSVELRLLKGENNALSDEIISIIGCDSVFVFEDQIFGKPRDAKEAIDRLEMMSSKSGLLMTGHAFLYKPMLPDGNRDDLFKGLIQEVITTRVEFSNLTRDEIERYVLTGEPLQCAGGFALEGKGGMFIRKLDGCYSNVIGLSLPWLRKALRESSFSYL